MGYRAHGNKVLFDHHTDEIDVRAECAPFDHRTAEKAVEMLNKAGYLNDVKRRYTDAARLIAKVEMLPGFRWIG